MTSRIEVVCPFDQKQLIVLGESLLCQACLKTYPVRQGIPRFVGTAEDPSQAQVQEAFRYKWTRGQWGYKSEHKALMKEFFQRRFGFKSESEIEQFFGGKIVLHAGIGNGQTEQYYLSFAKEVWGIDISESIDACFHNWKEYYFELAPKLKLVQSDLMGMPFADESFDVVISDGVLHHTPNTFKALEAIVRKLRRGGSVVFYVYKKKGPIREFVDDYLRSKLSGLDPATAWHELEPLTALAQELSNARTRIRVPIAVEILDLVEGEQDLQRWLYWNVMKFYWNDSLNFDENNHVNFDWYYPKYAWRHSPEEVRSWLEQLNLEPVHFFSDEAGISVIARK